jgi:hypothetical protein
MQLGILVEDTMRNWIVIVGEPYDGKARALHSLCDGNTSIPFALHVVELIDNTNQVSVRLYFEKII